MEVSKKSLIAILGSPIAYYRIFANISGCAASGLFLSQCFYWTGKSADKDGWFYKGHAEWEKEAGITRREVDYARRDLVKIGVLEEKKKGVPCRCFYRIDLDALMALIDNDSSLADSYKLDCTEAPNKVGGSVQTITENTTENTYKDQEQPLSSKESFNLEPPEIISPKPKAKENSADPRHGEIRNAIMDKYMAVNRVSPAWNGREAKCLSNFLREHSSWPTEKILECIRDRFRSEINTAQEPRYWIERLAEFAAGPLNAYGKPKNGSNGNGNSKEANRLADARAKLNVYAGAPSGSGADTVPDGAVVPYRGHKGTD
jgi:hypothetical protein